MLFTKWILPEGNPKNSALIRREYGVPAMVADILAARGLSAAATSELLEEEIGLEDPFLLPDMQEAVKRIEEALDENTVAKAVSAIRKADLLIVGGTSLTVYPAAGLLRYYRGDRLVLINRDATPYDAYADLVFHASLGTIFSQLV